MKRKKIAASTVTVAGALLSTLLLAGCGTSDQSAQSESAPTTITAVTTVMSTTTATVTQTKIETSTVTATPEAGATTSPASTPSTSEAPSAAATNFDRAWALHAASQMIYDIRTVDFRLRNDSAVSSALYLLSDDYPRMLDAGIPPGVEASEYKARLATLSSFAETAADEYYDQPTQGAARYAVVRKETGALFNELNSSIDGDLHLP